MKKLTLLTFLVFLSSNLYATLLPPNNLEQTNFKSNNMTEEMFYKITDKFEEIYKPIIKKRGGKLVIQKMWDVNTVNASARRFYPLFSLTIMGGLARHHLVTKDALMLTLCHEMGHLLGSAPRKSNIVNKWASVEGQSDYFTTLKCARRVWENDDNHLIVSQMHINDYVEVTCNDAFTNINKIAICKRSMMASLSIAKLMESVRQDGPISFETRDTNIVSKTMQDHPSSQCRLDTFISGSICEVNYKTPLSKTSAKKGACNRKTGHQVGVRPLCWYRPR